MKILKKYEVETRMKYGVGSINVRNEVIKDASPLRKDFSRESFWTRHPILLKFML